MRRTPVAVADPPAPRRKRTRPPTRTTDGWWGNGPPPWERWPGATIKIDSTWSVDRGRWETHDGKYFYDQAAANRAVEFFPDCLRHHIGEFAGQPFVLMDYQELLLTRPMFGWKHADTGLRRFFKIFAFLPKGNGKALALDTPIPTPNGWTTMGALSPGDWVIGASGYPIRVAACSDVLANRPCYRLTFDSGETVVADADHLWRTEQRQYGDKVFARATSRRIGHWWRHGLRTTEQIRATLKYSNGRYQSANHSVPTAQPVELRDRHVSVEPYTLGVWLGVGDSDCARVTVGAQDRDELFEHLDRAGTEVSSVRRTGAGAYRFRIGSVGWTGRARSVYAKLRVAGLFHNKHVPMEYLRASRWQRVALLQGLMDTDGTIASTGQCELTSTVQRLAHTACELLRTLGIKATIRESDAVLHGRVVGRRWRINFQAPTWPVFRLHRKANRQGARHSRRKLSGDHRIVKCESVPSVPVRCITVDSSDGLYLCSNSFITTHNSPWSSGTGLYLMLCDDEPAAEVYAAAGDKDQARIVFDNAKVYVEHDYAPPELREQCEVLRDSIYCEGTLSVYKVLSAEASTKHGFRPHAAIFDEFHVQRTRDLYEALKKSMVKRRQPLLIMVSHAGDDDESICGEEYDYAKSVLKGSIADESCLPVIFEASPKADWTSPAVWRRANPGFGVTIQPDGIARECLEAQNEPRKLNDFLRFHLNRWVNQATAWIPIDWWDGCLDETFTDADLVGLDCGAGLDLAQKWDLAAFVVAFRRYLPPAAPDEPALEVTVAQEETTGAVTEKVIALNYHLYVRPFFWIPENTMRQHEKDDKIPYSQWVDQGLVTKTPGDVIDYDRIFKDITTKIVPRFPKLKQRWICYDPAFATDLAGKLSGAGLKVAELLQNFKQFSEPSQVIEALLKGRRVSHADHRTLRNHWENIAIKTDDAGRIRPVKPKRASKRIDGAVATIMANAAMSLEPPPSEKTYQVFVIGGPKPKGPS